VEVVVTQTLVVFGDGTLLAPRAVSPREKKYLVQCKQRGGNWWWRKVVESHPRLQPHSGKYRLGPVRWVAELKHVRYSNSDFY